jgi:hypothetical protein
MKVRELQEGNSKLFLLTFKFESYIRKHMASHIFVLFTTSDLHSFRLIPEMIAQQWKSTGRFRRRTSWPIIQTLGFISIDSNEFVIDT